MLRRTLLTRGHATSNLFAPPHSGRWFNPPHQWTMSDTFVPAFFLGFSPMAICVYLYYAAYMPHFSHFQDQHYYPAQVYTKEFIHEYKRLERWRWYWGNERSTALEGVRKEKRCPWGGGGEWENYFVLRSGAVFLCVWCVRGIDYWELHFLFMLYFCTCWVASRSSFSFYNISLLCTRH